MPTYRGICISVQTQYGHKSIPEYPPLSVPLHPSPRKEHPSSNINSYKLTPSSNPSPSDSTPTHPPKAEVYVPAYPGSQFWIHYLCPEPPPHVDERNLLKLVETRFFYFKLYLRGTCVLSWGVGGEDGWGGKVSFGIYDSGTDFHGRRILEKRGFFFKKEDGNLDPHAGFEMRVFRSKARRREENRYEKWEKGVDGGCGFRMNGAGRMKKSEPRKMYTYALIDPVDQPYAVFKYHCRTARQLEDLGFDMAGGYNVEVTPTPSPCLSFRSPIELSPRAPAIPIDNLTTGRLSFPPGIRLSPTKSRGRERVSSPVKKSQQPRDAVDLSHEFHHLTLTEERPSKKVIRRPTWALSKPLPDVPHKREASGGSQSLSRSTSNVAEKFKSVVQSRLIKRRGDSRDERTTSM